MCNNKVVMNVRDVADLSTKEITFTCGDYTSAGLAQCPMCRVEADKTCPQGWVDFPGDKCKHGTYIGGDRDCACHYCENEE